jgi:uncharacterized membrane protein YccC
VNPAPSAELADRLGRAQAALEQDDLETADAHLASAADLCRRLQAAGLGIPPEELATLRDLAERCGTSLVSVGERLNAESQRDENHRRGIESYHATLTR